MSSTGVDAGGETPRALLRRLYDVAVAAAHPAGALPPHLPAPPNGGRVLLFGGGKAAGSMVAAAERFYRERHGLGPDRLAGLGVTRHGYEERTAFVPVVGAGHPVPDQAGIDAAGRLLALAAEATPADLAMVLLSGGGSANWIAPAGALTLEGKQALTRALLRSGASIGEINTVRKHLSRIKGGRLARALGGAAIVTLAISDVPGDDPSTIASGPTVPDPTTLADARAILARRSLAPGPVVAALLDDPASESPKPGDPAFARARFTIVTRPADALRAAEQAGRAAGYHVVSLGADVEGEAREVAAAHAEQARALRAAGRPALLLSGGELTVSMAGGGRGGPNQEYALALAIALRGAGGVHALSADTDGADGGGGLPTDPAGAFIDPSTLARAERAGISPRAALMNNDSTGFFEALGDLLATGPTRTNANDLRAILVEAGT